MSRLQNILDAYDGAHTVMSISQREVGKAKPRMVWFVYYICATCESRMSSRVDSFMLTRSNCENCNRRLKNLKHGLRDKRIYPIWAEMLGRTTRPSHKKYPRYGGRGIKVEFKTITEFYRWAKVNGYKEENEGDYKEYQAIDRIDNDGNYSASNCQFITVSENSRKKTGPYNV